MGDLNEVEHDTLFDHTPFGPFTYREPGKKRGQTQLEHYYAKRQRTASPDDASASSPPDDAPASSADLHQQRAIDAALDGKNIFISGQAGTGKSFTLKLIVEQLRADGRCVRVASTTGSSAVALDLQATTIHSLLNMGDTGTRSADVYIRRLRQKPSTKHRAALNALDVLVIEEVSMVHDQFLEKVETILSAIRAGEHSGDRPWGGLQLVFCGDFAQLKFIPDRGIDPPQRFAFLSLLWSDITMHELHTQHRQSEDHRYAELLERARFSRLTSDDMQLLRSCVRPPPPGADDHIVRIFSKNSDVDAYNEFRFTQLDESTTHMYTRTYDLTGDSAKIVEKARKDVDRRMRNHERLKLRTGASVMLLCNLNVAAGLANSTSGTIIGFAADSGYPIVDFPSAHRQMTVHPHCWRFPNEVGWWGTCTHIPLTLSYALTAHKAQGLTLEAIASRLDRRSMFVPNMGYTILSRVRSSAGLYLSVIERDAIYTMQEIIDFYS